MKSPSFLILKSCYYYIIIKLSIIYKVTTKIAMKVNMVLVKAQVLVKDRWVILSVRKETYDLNLHFEIIAGKFEVDSDRSNTQTQTDF